MGGDGGVIASNRKYMRGAGTADKTGDLNRHGAQKFNAQEVMATCALTKTALHNAAGSSGIVSDLYGHLYHKEAAVQALLRRKQQNSDGYSDTTTTITIGSQVRRLTDLYDVRFHREEQRNDADPSCPISGKALTGRISAILLVPCKEGVPNVVSESALSQLSPEELEAEYGQIRRRVRLAPNPVLLEKIKERVQQEHDKDDEERRKAKKEKKKGKKSKRKRDGKDKNSTNSDKKKRIDEDNRGGECELSKSSGYNRIVKSSTSSVGKEVQSRVDSAIQQNSVLSSLFTKKGDSSKLTDKEKKDNLFAR